MNVRITDSWVVCLGKIQWKNWRKKNRLSSQTSMAVLGPENEAQVKPDREGWLVGPNTNIRKFLATASAIWKWSFSYILQNVLPFINPFDSRSLLLQIVTKQPNRQYCGFAAHMLSNSLTELSKPPQDDFGAPLATRNTVLNPQTRLAMAFLVQSEMPGQLLDGLTWNWGQTFTGIYLTGRTVITMVT